MVDMGVSIVMGVPLYRWMFFFSNNIHLSMDDLGDAYFRTPPYSPYIYIVPVFDIIQYTLW